MMSDVSVRVVSAGLPENFEALKSMESELSDSGFGPVGAVESVLLNSFSSEYADVYCVEMDSGRFMPAMLERFGTVGYREKIESGCSFDDIVSEFIESFVADKDVTRVSAACSLDNVREKLVSDGCFSCVYRTKANLSRHTGFGRMFFGRLDGMFEGLVFIWAIGDFDGWGRESSGTGRLVGDGSHAGISERIVELLGSIAEERNIENADHVRRVRSLTGILAYQVMVRFPEYGLTPERVRLVSSLSVLHDIGKIFIPDSLLMKPGRLTKDEFEIMKTHCIRGCEIIDKAALGGDDEFVTVCKEICRWHHEKYDGSGYPDGLKGDEIPISAQIVSLADSFDSIVTKRAYNDSYSCVEAYNLIRNGSCGAFSQKLLECLDDCRDLFFSEYMLMSPKREPEYRPQTRLDDVGLSARQELYILIQDLRVIYDMVRLVDPIRMQVFDICADGTYTVEAKKCYEFWDRSSRCENCISAKACSNMNRQEKFEFIESGAHHMTSKCVEVDGSLFAIEIVSHVADDFLVDGKGRGGLADIIEKFKWRVYIDPLTGVKNRRYYEEHLVNFEFEQAVALMDVDCLKMKNDMYGHSTGDFILKSIAEILRGSLNGIGDVIRYGGDEFLLFFKSVSRKDFLDLMKSIRKAVLALRIDDMPEIRVTVSIGCVHRDEPGRIRFDDVDTQLYLAKSLRNSIAIDGSLCKI